MNNKIIVIIVVIVLIVGGFLVFRNRGTAPTESDLNSATYPVGTDVNDTPETNMPVTETPTNVKEFTVNTDHFSFLPKTLTVNKGDTVKITVKNTLGTHNLKIDEFNASTKLLAAGESETITFVADKSGPFQYYCSVGNHRALGMWGTLTVK